MNTKFLRLLLSITGPELRELASDFEYASVEYDMLFDAADAIADALDLLIDLAAE